jgi:predicted NACHT family NTPase
LSCWANRARERLVLALYLLLDLLDHRRGDPTAPQPVPVRVNAANWNVETHFNTWLTESLAADYGLLPPVARKLVEDRRVLPVLDGLDEMDPLGASPKRARAAVEQLNQTPWRGRPVILTCRAAVYD